MFLHLLRFLYSILPDLLAMFFTLDLLVISFLKILLTCGFVTAQKMKFPIKDMCSKCNCIRISFFVQFVFPQTFEIFIDA